MLQQLAVCVAEHAAAWHLLGDCRCLAQGMAVLLARCHARSLADDALHGSLQWGGVLNGCAACPALGVARPLGLQSLASSV